MPKRKEVLTPEEQSERFKREAQRLIDAGELNPTDAEAALERLVATQRQPTPSSADSGDLDT